MDKFNPALPKLETSPVLNDVMFQSMFKSWLEDKGFIAEIRSQIRYKFVNILRNTAVGKKLCRKFSQQNSLSKQALNMIVVEYLFNNDYEYSLSVFSTESALNNVIPNLLQNSSYKEIHKKIHYNDIQHILELLGFPETSIISSDILKTYQQETQYNSLLSCLITILKKQTENKSQALLEPYEDKTFYFDVTNESNLVKEIVNTLKIYKVPLNDIKLLIENIKKNYFGETHDIERKYSEEMSQYKMEIKNKEEYIEEISKKNGELELRLIKLVKDYKSLKQKNRHNTKDNENVVAKNNFNKQALELQKESACVLPHCGTSCESNLNATAELKKENGILKTKIIDLKNTNDAQHKKLMMLSWRYNDLVNAFMDCQNKLLLLSSQNNPVQDPSLFQQPQRNLKTYGVYEEISSESVTEEIVKEARNRLKALDNENNAIEAVLSCIHTT